MPTPKSKKSRTRHAVLGVLSYGPATGYEIRKLLSETTGHFWKESYGQIYPTLETLHKEGLIEEIAHKTTGREKRRFAVRPEGFKRLREWIRSKDFQLKPGRNELLLKLFFARAPDAEFLVPQVETYREIIRALCNEYRGFETDPQIQELPPDSQLFMGTTIDFGISASKMQINWCERTLQALRDLQSRQQS